MKKLTDKIDRLKKGENLIVEFKEPEKVKEVRPEDMKEAVKELKLNESLIVRF